MPTASDRMLTVLEKALEINLDPGRYGTFAEIGAGQEVVRWFFQAGAAAGTISKSISAYDMQVSDAIYGPCQRYVSRERLESMLECEQKLTRSRLSESRGGTSSFFTFADTVSARNFHGTNECHAWMGIRYQFAPGAEDSVIIIHARMLDEDNAAQQEALGIVGVNLIHGAYMLYDNPKELIESLIDDLSADRIEIDMIDVRGPAFEGVDNRILALRLVQLGLSGAAMFAPDSTVLQPSEVLRKKALIVQRGRFRPVTHVNIDMLQSATRKLQMEDGLNDDEILPIMEISMHNLLEETNACLDDFVSRAEVAAATGCTVMISDFREYHRLAAYLSRYTQRPIGLAMGLATLRNLFEERYYTDLDGGILEGFGRLFKEQVRLLVYPLKNESTGKIECVDQLELSESLQRLYDYLGDRHGIIALTEFTEEHLDIHSPHVLKMIAAGDKKWCGMVPEGVASKIIEQNLFGYADRKPA